MFNGLVRPPPFLRPRASAPENFATDMDAGGEPSALDETARLPADLGTAGFDVEPVKPAPLPTNLARDA
jgi:hypothetical protein